jgi:hypothetical protein
MADKKYTVKQGDCISSIAYTHGLFPSTLWNHPDNAELMKNRQESRILYPGDVVVIPEFQEKEEDCSTEQKHRFRRKGVPDKLRIRFVDEMDKPRKNVSYVIDIKTYSGAGHILRRSQTDGDGYLTEVIPPDAFEGEILLGEGEEKELIGVMLGCLDPVKKVTGIQARLNNLGYFCGDQDGVLGEMTLDALRRFQKDHGLKVLKEGEEKVSDETLAKLLQECMC